MGDNKAAALAAKELGNESYKMRDFETALKHYNDAINYDGTDMNFYTNRSAVYFEQKEYEKCIKECTDAVDIGRENSADFKIIAKAYSRAAGAYVKLGDLANAKLYYQKSLAEHRTPEIRNKLSETEKQLYEIESKAYLNPDIAIQEENKGNELYQKGDYPGAVRHYTEAIKRNPDDAKIFSNRAACLQKLMEFHAALKDCDDCIRIDPQFVKGHIRKGYALLALKEFTKAQSAFQKALDIDENCQEAIEGFKKCVITSGSNPEEVRKRAIVEDDMIEEHLNDNEINYNSQEFLNNSRCTVSLDLAMGADINNEDPLLKDAFMLRCDEANCSQSYARLDSLNTHRFKTHKLPPLTSELIELIHSDIFMCTACSRAFGSDAILAQHKSFHIIERKSHGNIKSLKRHMNERVTMTNRDSKIIVKSKNSDETEESDED